jgi:RNA polymerase subunit RPABC4/transcription elongation factor Spt4
MAQSTFLRPAVDPFIECPNCKRLLRFGTSVCPDCREEIAEEYSEISALIHHFNTQACSAANEIKTGEPAIVIISIAAAISFLLGWNLLYLANFFSPLLSIFVIGVWFKRYGNFRLGDEEYASAKRRMSQSLKLWLAYLGALIIVCAYMLKYPRVPW